MFGFFGRVGSVMQAVRQLMAKKPSLSFAKAKEFIVANTYRHRSSKYKPHQGQQKKARRARQIACGMLRTN